ncbi:MAG: alpha/beta fold hydrolase [Promethearchaeota archaeon]
MSSDEGNKKPELFYEKKGEGEVVVLIHGFTLDNRMWNDQFDLLAKSYQVIRFDQRGHGRSEGVSNRFKQEDDLKGLFETLKIDSAHVVGLSMGGHVATIFTIEYPELVHSLVVADSAITFNPSRECDKRIFNYIMKGINQDLKSALKDWLSDPLFEPAMRIPNVKKRMEEMVLNGHVAQGQGAFFLKATNAIAPRPPPEKRLSEINIPTLIIVGELDIPQFQENANILSSGIKGAKKVIISGAGHMSNMENSDEFNNILLSFLTEQKD